MGENKLIAEFMGLVRSSVVDKYWTEKNSEGIGIGELVGLQFHTDWNWLMKVVEKIESKGFDVFINTFVCRISDVGEDRFEDIETFNSASKIQAVHSAVVDFIKWHNNLKNN